MSNSHKTPISRTLPALIDQRILAALNAQGLALPGNVLSVNGAIVTVNLSVPGITLPGSIAMPVLGSEYIRIPIQPGDLGICVSADAYIGAHSGLGSAANAVGSTPPKAIAQGNLSNLVWVPIGNKNWTAVDPNAVVLTAPNGVVLQDSEGKTTYTQTPSGIDIDAQDTYEITAGTSIKFTVGSHSIVIDSSGISLDGVPFLPHSHSGVQTGSGDSGPVVP